jgi:outer membrane protein assembly factor BamB
MHQTRWLCALVLCAGLAPAEDWPGWRGPRGDGTSRETGVPLRWSATDNVAWKTPIPGTGHSSPAIHGNRVFVTSCREEEKKRVLLCLDRVSGKVLWEKTVLVAPLERKHSLNSYASSTPATDGKHVWVSFLKAPDMVVVCFDMDGNEVWRKVPGPVRSVHGFCSPPILYRDLVILNGDQDAPNGQPPGYLVALDRATGKEVWRTDRPHRTRSYCAPLIVEAAGRTQLVMAGSMCVASYDPDNGKLIWMHDGPTEQYVASLVYGDDTLFLTTGYPEYHFMGLRPGGRGDITGSEHVAWHHPKLPARDASYVPSPVAHDRYFFVVSDQGWATCFEAKTGKKLWREKLGRHHSASLIVAEGRVYLVADEGDTYVVKAGPTFELLAKNRLGEECYASPAVAQGQLFVRTASSIICIGKPQTGQK